MRTRWRTLNAKEGNSIFFQLGHAKCTLIDVVISLEIFQIIVIFDKVKMTPLLISKQCIFYAINLSEREQMYFCFQSKRVLSGKYPRI